MVVLQQRSSSREGRLPLKVVFHQRVSSNEGRLSQKVIFHRRSSSTEGRLPPKVVLHHRSSSTIGHLPPKVVFHWRSSSHWSSQPQLFSEGYCRYFASCLGLSVCLSVSPWVSIFQMGHFHRVNEIWPNKSVQMIRPWPCEIVPVQDIDIVKLSNSNEDVLKIKTMKTARGQSSIRTIVHPDNHPSGQLSIR